MKMETQNRKYEREAPSIERLIELNRHISRRLYAGFDGGKFILVDGEEKRIRANPVSFPHLVTVAMGYHLPRYEETPFHLGTAGASFKGWRGLLTEYEALLILGKDRKSGDSSSYESTIEDIHAMCNASTDGPISNAYVLGERRRNIQDDIAIISVQYYQIGQKRHKELGIEYGKTNLEYLIERVEEERERV